MSLYVASVLTAGSILGTPLSKADIEAAITAVPGEDIGAIIVTLNARRESDSPFSAPVAPPRLMADSHENLIEAMRKFNIPKIVTMSAFGVGSSSPHLNIILRVLIRKLSNMSYQFKDHDLVDTEVKASGINYVLVRPSMLTEGPPAPIREWGEKGVGVGMLYKITRESVAEFLVDAAVEAKRNRETVVITN